MLKKVNTVLTRIAPLALLMLMSAYSAWAQAPTFNLCQTTGTQTLPQYSICEIVLSQSTYTTDFDAYTKPDVQGVFTNSSTGTVKTVHGFYDKPTGSTQIVFKIRFNLSEQGSWSYTTKCKLQATGQDCGIASLNTGNSFTVRPSVLKGFLRRDAGNPSRFVYDNGVHPFVWGQTYYQIINNAVGGGGWQTAVTNSKNNRLNKFRMLLYPWWAYTPYPDTQPFAGSTTIPNHDKPNINHWKKFDEVIGYLNNNTDVAGNKLLAEIILFKDPATEKDPATGQPRVIDNNRTFGQQEPQDDRYIKYAIARYGAFTNVMWCLSNEWQIIYEKYDSTKDKEYWRRRANTILQNDPWMYNSVGYQRATSIHPKNDPLFQFYDQPWPSHAVLQFSVGHTNCGASPCANPDEWANFSILNNRNRGLPVANDEYGYLNTPLKNNAGVMDRNKQRWAMWAIAVAGGYGTFGDNTGIATNQNPPAIRSDWLDQNLDAHMDVKFMADFFTNNFPDTWWQMTPNNARVSRTANSSMRVYAMERLDQYVIYAVPTGTAAPGTFIVNNLPAGSYQASFYNPRTGLFDPTTTPFRSSPSAVTLTTPTYEDWVVLITYQGP